VVGFGKEKNSSNVYMYERAVISICMITIKSVPLCIGYG
jgi:hypothetical protein